jgi:hypothetical protein
MEILRKYAMQWLFLLSAASWATPRMQAQSVNSVQTEVTPIIPSAESWQDLVSQGKIKFFAYNNEGEETTLTSQDSVYGAQITGIGQAITDILEDSLLGAEFRKHIQQHTLRICILDAEVAMFDPASGIVYLGSQPSSLGYLDVVSGKVIPMSEHHITIHELIHFVNFHSMSQAMQQSMIQQIYPEERQTVTSTDRIMAKYGEPPRTNYLFVSGNFLVTSNIVGRPQIGYYQSGQRFEDFYTLDSLPDILPRYEEVIAANLKRAAAAWPPETFAQAFKEACDHYAPQIEKRGTEEDKRIFALFREKGMVTYREYTTLMQTLEEFSKDVWFSPEEWKRLRQMDGEMQSMGLKYRPAAEWEMSTLPEGVSIPRKAAPLIITPQATDPELFAKDSMQDFRGRTPAKVLKSLLERSEPDPSPRNR